MAEIVIAGLIEQNANIKTEIDSSVDYGVANMKLTRDLPVAACSLFNQIHDPSFKTSPTQFRDNWR